MKEFNIKRRTHETLYGRRLSRRASTLAEPEPDPEPDPEAERKRAGEWDKEQLPALQARQAGRVETKDAPHDESGDVLVEAEEDMVIY